MTSYIMPEMQTDEEYAEMLRDLGLTEEEAEELGWKRKEKSSE